MSEHLFSGIELQPVSTVTKFPKVYIESAFVRAFEDVYGEIYYEVVGCGAKVLPQKFHSALARLVNARKDIKQRGFAASRFREEDRKRRSAYTLQLIGEIQNGQEKSPDR